MNTNIAINNNLFYVLTGLVASGADAYDHNDVEVTALAKYLGRTDRTDNLHFSTCAPVSNFR